MSDLRERFRTLDYLPEFDIWTEAATRASAAPAVSRSVGVPVLLSVTLVLAAVGGAALVASGARLPVPVTPATPSESASESLPTSSTDLSAIVVTMANIPEGLTVYRTVSGIDALDASDTTPVGAPGFVDAVLTEFDSDDDHEGDHEGRYRTFAAVFETVADAEKAFADAAANHAAPDGWGMTRELAPERPLGEQSVHLATGTEYGYPRLSVYLWRIDKILLQAVDFHPYDIPGLLLSIAGDMTTRATTGE